MRTSAVKVVRLEPRLASYAEASATFLTGRSMRCISLLRGHDSIEASFLRTRAYLRMRRFDDAYAELGKWVPPLDDHATCAQHQFLLGTTLARGGKVDEAREALASADAYATSTADPILITEVASYRAFTAYLRDEFDEMEAIAFDSLDARGGSAHARLLEMLGFVAALRGNVDRQIAMLLAANQHLLRLPARDMYLEANMLVNLAVPVVEANPPGLAQFVRTRAGEIAWHDDLRTLHFAVTHHLAWLDALAGEHISAFRRLRVAAELGPSPARRAEALVSRAILAREMGESINAAECVADAKDQVDQVDWNATNEDERLSLIEFAALIAPWEPERAASHVERYKAISQAINPFNLAAHGDPLYRAKEAYALGLVAWRSRGPVFATPSLHEAFRLFRSASSCWRAASVALDLYQIEGDRTMLSFARREVIRIPHSWLARRSTLIA